MIRAQLENYVAHSDVIPPSIKDAKKSCEMSTKSVAGVTSTAASKPLAKAKKKAAKAKKSSYRRQYKKLKPKLKRLIEEGILLKEKLRRKQEKLIEMSRDIHYILGRLMPYQKKLAQSIVKPPESPVVSIINDHPQVRPQCVDVPAPSWEGFTSCSSNIMVESSKSRLNFCLPPEVERQLASMMSDRPPLTLPDDIFSES